MTTKPPFSANGHHPDEASPDPVEVEAVRGALNRWTLPPDLARPEARQRLSLALDAEWEARTAKLAAHPVETSFHQPARERIRWAWLILRAQFRLVSRLTWAATLLVMTLGYVVSLVMSSAPVRPDAATAMFPFALLAPLVAAFGVAFLYGLEIDPILELQLSAPISPRMILLARLTLIFGFNLALGLIGSIALTPLYPTMTLWSIVAQWLAPMTFLSALAFTLTALFFDSMMSSMICLLLWFALVIRHMGWYPDGSFLNDLPNLLSADYHIVFYALAFALAALAIGVAGDEERTVTFIQGRNS